MAFSGRTFEAVLANGWRETDSSDDLPRCLEILDAAFERYHRGQARNPRHRDVPTVVAKARTGICVSRHGALHGGLL
jgi:hypothetical protein